MGLIADAQALFEKFPGAVTAFAYSLAVFVTLVAVIVGTSFFTGARFTLYPSFGFDSAVFPRRTLVYEWGREYDISKVTTDGIDIVDDFKNNSASHMDVNVNNTFCFLAQVRGGSPSFGVDIKGDGKGYRLIAVGNSTASGTVRVSCVKLN